MVPKFLVAKYAPDVRRMEPRNFGIIVWSNGEVRAKFAGEDPGDLSNSRPPGRLKVRDLDAYRQWLQSWRIKLGSDSLEYGRGETVHRESPEFLNVLRQTGRGNYLLMDGGHLLHGIKHDDIDALVDYLYKELVESEEDLGKPHKEFELLKSATQHVLRTSGLKDRHDFQSKWPALCRVYGEQKYFEFDYSLGPTGKPYSVYHHVLLSNQRLFNGAAFMFEWFKQSTHFPGNERCCALVHTAAASPSPRSESSVNYRILKQLGVRIVDVSNEDNATETLKQISQLNGQL